MARYALVNEKGDVVNVIEWDGKTPWNPPEKCFVIQSEEADIKDSYDSQARIFSKKGVENEAAV